MTEETQETKIDIEALQAQNEQLQSELERFKTKHAEAEKHRKKAEKEYSSLSNKFAEETGDLESIKKSYTERMTDLENKLDETKKFYQERDKTSAIDKAVRDFAASLIVPGKESIIEPHIRSRLTAEIIDNDPVVRVLKDGKISALSLDDLKKEFKSNELFAEFIRHSDASGSGNISQHSASGTKTINRTRFEAFSPAEKSRFVREGGAIVD